MKVLIVDDHPENRYMLDTLLRSAGHETIGAGNGAEAIAHARAGCDLVVSDVLMPQMDGFTLCRELKADDSLRGIPIIFYTATYTDEKDAEFGLSLGAERYLVKPVEPGELLRTFTEVAAAPAKQGGTSTAGDHGYFREYNSRLISKLEQKSLELEASNRALKAELAMREKLELQLRHAQKLDAVGRLAGGIAHDFNNIIGGILGHAELARMEDGDGDGVRSHLDGICAAAHRARDLVQQILTFSRQKERVRKPLHLHSALEDALKLLRASLPAGIELHRAFDSAAPSVLADLTEIHQLATNLVTNAWHAIGDGPGVIELKTDRFHVDADFSRTHPELLPGDYVRLAVTDSGSGMDARTLENIFEPFFSTKAPGKGSGLGLAVVHGIMKSCGGAITVYSESGRGSTFHLYFPAIAESASAAVAETPHVPVGTGERVLLIDDDVTLTTLGKRFLTRLGYHVEIFTNPVTAVARFREQPFDLIITDLTMPYATGVEVARDCHAARPAVPIILMTGFNPAMEEDELRRNGIVTLLLKPYTIQTFGETIAAALSAGRVIPPK